MPPTGKRIFITGCSTGLGYAAALLLSAAGYQVIATVRTENDAARLREVGKGQIEPLLMEVTDSASVHSTVSFALANGPIDVLVNNIGMPCIGAIEELPIDTLARAMDINFYGMLRVCQAVIPAMRARGSGLIVNVSSSIGAAALPLYGGYCATKFAVEAASEAMLLELAPFGIAVKLLRPGIIITPFVDKKSGQMPTQLPPGSVYTGRLDNPSPAALMSHVSRPEDVAAVLLRVIEDPAAPFRTEAGADSRQWIEARRTHDDASFFARVAGEGYGFGVT